MLLLFALLPLALSLSPYQQLSSHKGIIQLDDSSFSLYTKYPRNYTLVVVFNALDPKIGCEPCRVLDKELQLISPPEGLFIASLDFSNGRETFSKFQLKHAPVLFLFTQNAELPERWDPENPDADDVVNWINRMTSFEIRFKRPLDYQKVVVNITLGLFFVGLCKVVYDKLSGVFHSAATYTILSLLFIVNMNAGYMWNQIRGAAYSGVKDGRVEIIANGFQNQFQIETQIIAMVYAILAALVVLLGKRIPEIREESKQRVAGYVVLALFLVVYSVLINIFRMKNGGYPFRLLL